MFNVVNSQNNERIFFSDRVILVEGLSDRIVFERVLDLHGRTQSSNSIVEVVAVGGKGLFEAYAAVMNACKIPFAVVADLDYLEQVGTDEIKQLFTTNAREIRQDVIENVKSLDGDALVAAIDNAIANGNWKDAMDIWDYIKGNRRELKRNLNEEEAAKVNQCIEELRRRSVYVLKRGALEQYLPVGYRSKDLNKLIRFTRSAAFWESLESGPQAELVEIAKALLA